MLTALERKLLRRIPNVRRFPYLPAVDKNVKNTLNKKCLFSLKDLNHENAKIGSGSLRILRVRSKDVQTSGCHLALGVRPGF